MDQWKSFRKNDLVCTNNMPIPDKSESIRRAVEQARLELGIQSKSPPPRRVAPRRKDEDVAAVTSPSPPNREVMEMLKDNSSLANYEAELDVKLSYADNTQNTGNVVPSPPPPASTEPAEQETNGEQAISPEPDIKQVKSERIRTSPPSPALPCDGMADHSIFSVENRSAPTMCYDVWVRYNCSWQELQEAIAKKLKLYDHASVVYITMVDEAGDVLSPVITSASKFFKIYNNYEEGMRFIVDVDAELEARRKEDKELEEFRALALKLTFRNSDSGEQATVYVERSCVWDTLTRAIVAEFPNLEPQWIKHFIVEDADGDEITPPLNSSEKFWRFCRSASMHNGDVFVFTLDDARMRKDFERKEYEAFVARCDQVRWSVPCPSGSDSSAVDTRESIALIPRGADWDEIRQHVAKSMPDVVKLPDWIARMVLLDSDGDDLSPPIDGELIFWKVMNSYDHQSGMCFEVSLDQAKIRDYEEEQALESFRKSSKHFRVCLANKKGAELTDIYVPHNCKWEELTEGVASFLQLEDATWIDYFILLDTEGDPLSPPLNTIDKFWKMGHKLTASNSMALYVHLKPEATRKLKEEEFIANACAFRVVLQADESREGVVHVAPDSGWGDLCRRVADALLLDSADWVSHFVLVDAADGDVLSPALKTAEKFWRFYKKHEENSTFRVYEDEVLIARAMAEKVQRLKAEKEREEELTALSMANRRVFRCRLVEGEDLGGETNMHGVVSIHVENMCGWADIVNAIGTTNVVEADFIDHLVLVDSKGIVISVPIKTAKMFWKFASNINQAQEPIFNIHVNHAYQSKIIRRRAEEALKRSMLLIHVSLAIEDKPEEVLMPANASWDAITEAIASAIAKTDIEPQWISHLVMYDIDGDQLSPELDSADKVWGTLPLYRIEESMVFVASLNPAKMAESAKIKEHEEFLRRAKYFKMRLLSIESLKQAESEVLLQPNCLWQDVVTTIAEVFSLDSSAWIDHMILIDGDGDELSKHIDNATLFWKTAATYNFEDNKVFTITLSLKEINKTREAQEHAAFMAAAEHIPLVLASNTKSTATLDMMLHSSWDAVCEKVLEIFHLDPPKSITKLHLVDEEFDELSPPVQNSEKFWKIYLQNYQAGAGMAFAVHMSNESFWKDTPKCENSPLATRIVPTDAGPPTASLTTNSQPTEAVPIKQEDPEDILESASTESVCSQFAEVSPEVISEYHEACEKGDLPAVRNFIEVVKIDPNLRNTNLSTGMHFACLKGHLHVAQFLSESGGKANSANSVGLTPLDCACISGNLALCEWIHPFCEVTLSATTDTSPQSCTPTLHHAAINGHNEVVMWLILNRADLEVKGPFGTTALMEAAHVGHLNIVITLCAAGADVNACDGDGITALHLACVEGHTDVVRYLVSKNVDLNHADNNDKTPFLYACSGGHLTLAKWLLSSGANHLTTGGFHDKLNTATHLAAQSGNLETVKWLVEECGMDPNAVNEKGATAADFAFAAGHQSVASYLRCSDTGSGGRYTVDDLESALDADDFVTAKQILERVIDGFSDSIDLPYGTSPLHFVAASGHTQLAQFLVMGGADVNAVSDVGRTPLHYAAFKGRLEMAKYLFGVGANPDVSDHYGYTGLSIALKNGDEALTQWFSSVTTDRKSSPGSNKEASSPSLLFSCLGPQQDASPAVSDFARDLTSDITVHRPGHHIDDYNTRPHPYSDELHAACKAGDLTKAKNIIQSGAPINSRVGPSEPSPLHYAVASGNLALVQYLLDKGAHLNHQNVVGPASFEVDSDKHEAMTPLHIACDKKNDTMIMYLIKKGADLNMKNKAGDTPLHIICLLGQHQILQQIINLPRSVLPSLNLDVRSSHLLNLLHCAADAGSLETAQLLIDNDVGINSFDDEKKTPLHYACGNGSLEVAKLLLGKGAILDLQDTSSRTPLLYACSSGNLNLVEFLVSQGACLEATTSKGNSALHIACKYGSLRLVQWLVSNGLDMNKANSSEHLPVYYAGLNGFSEIVEWLETKMANPTGAVTMEFEN